MTDAITQAAARLGVELNAGQRRAVTAILADVTKQKTHLLTGFAGVGKTVVLLVAAVALRGDGLKVMMCAPTHQAVAVLGKKLKAADIAVPTATLARLLSLSPKPRGERLVFTRRKKAEPIEADVVLVDECFVGDARVNTPHGPVKIKDVRPGDIISNAIGSDRVVGVSRKEAADVAIVKFGGKAVASSCCHRFFTSRGVVRASNLRPGDQLISVPASVRLLQDGIRHQELDVPVLLCELRKALVAPVPDIQTENIYRGEGGEDGGWAEAVSPIRNARGACPDRPNSQTQPLQAPGCAGKNQPRVEDKGAQAKVSRGQWETAAAGAGAACGGVGAELVAGAHSYGWATPPPGLADLLQDRYREPQSDDSDRGGRGVSLLACPAGAGSAEGSVPDFLRVESVEIYQSGSPCLDQWRDGDGKLYLYDLQAERHSSFGVEDALVHNCSMISSDLMGYIRRHLTSGRGVLFSGDPAQLPPVGEAESPTFTNSRHSHLSEIVRQAADNPIIAAAHMIRAQQGHAVDWSWCRNVKTQAGGIYRPRDLDAWMHKAFTAAEFQADPTAYRYLAWTNRRVAEVNDKVRGWLYGEDIPTPFVVGERALLRAPIVVGDSIIANTNEEARVTAIEAAEHKWTVEGRGNQRDWWVLIPTWEMKLKRDEGDSFAAHMIRDHAPFETAQDKLREGHRWKDLHAMRQFFGNFQSVYARTVHTSQGETHKHTFLDVPDIRRRMHDNPLEMQQLCYVGATRPTTSLILAGI